MIDLGPRNGPQNAPTSSPRGPQDALGARLPLEVGFGAILGPFWDPFGTPKIMLSLWRGAIFANFASRAREPEIAPPNGSKIEPKTTPGGPRMARNVAPNRCSNFDQISTPNLAILELQHDTQNHSKICLRAQGPPRARPGPAQRPPESLSGGILGSFWLQFGPSGGSCSSFFGVHVCFFLACCLSIAGALFLLRPLLRCSPSELPGYEAQVTKAIASWFS